MHEIPYDEGGNGRIHRDDNAPCPFYELGTADFHNFVKEFSRHNSLIEKLVNNVPMKTHILSLVAVIIGCVGAQVALKFLESATVWAK